jgi:heme exporter protein C
MQTLTQRLANPTRFMELSARMLPWVSGAAAVVIAYGL